MHAAVRVDTGDGGTLVRCQGAGEVSGGLGGIEVEPEVADVRAADAVDNHVVAMKRRDL